MADTVHSRRMFVRGGYYWCSIVTELPDEHFLRISSFFGMNPETLDKLNFEGPFFERIQTSLEEKYTQQRLEAELKAR